MMSLLAVVGCLFYFNRVPSKAIAKYQTGIANGHGVAFYNDAVPEETAEKGTAENPFVVLELLSNKSLMVFGWVV